VVAVDVYLAEISSNVAAGVTELSTLRPRHLAGLWHRSYLRIEARRVERIRHNFADEF